MDDDKSPGRKSKMENGDPPVNNAGSIKNLKSRSKLKKGAGDNSDSGDGESSPNNNKKEKKVSYKLFFILIFYRNHESRKSESFQVVFLKISLLLTSSGSI
jgi:hypothetical protein